MPTRNKSKEFLSDAKAKSSLWKDSKNRVLSVLYQASETIFRKDDSDYHLTNEKIDINCAERELENFQSAGDFSRHEKHPNPRQKGKNDNDEKETEEVAKKF